MDNNNVFTTIYNMIEKAEYLREQIEEKRALTQQVEEILHRLANEVRGAYATDKC